MTHRVEKMPWWGLLVALALLLALSPARAITWLEFSGTHAASKTLIYKEEGKTQLHLTVFSPPDVKPDERRPALLCIHGGGWTGGSPDILIPYCAYFASRGMVVYNLEYRLAQEGGVTVFDCIEDCRAALRYLRTNAETEGIDPTQITVLGESSGGHLAACLGIMRQAPAETTEPVVSDVPDAMVLYNPVVDLSSLTWTGNLPGVKPLQTDAAAETDTPEARLRQLSPIFSITENCPPCLLIQGTDDVTVPIEQVDRFTKAMTDAKNRCDYERLAGKKHAFALVPYSDEATITAVIRRTDTFLASLGYLTGPPTL